MIAAQQQHLLNLLREASRNGGISNFGGLLDPQIDVATSTVPAPAHIQRADVAADLIAAAQRQLHSTAAALPAPVVPPTSAVPSVPLQHPVAAARDSIMRFLEDNGTSAVFVTAAVANASAAAK